MLRTAYTLARDRGTAFWQSIHLPDRFRGTIVEKWARYWDGLLTDYGDVVRDSVTDIRRRPLRAAAIAAVAGVAGAAVHYNPSEIDYRCAIIQARDEVSLVAPAVRNPASHLYVSGLEALCNEKRIRRLNLGMVSLYWVDEWSVDLGHIKAQCEFLKPKLLTWHKRVIEIGFWGKFWALDKALVDFDVNPAEWEIVQT